MQPNKTKISLIIGAMFLGVSGASMAAQEQFFISATTIDDVSITETQILSFGSNIFTTVGDCSINVSNLAGTAAPSDVTLQIDSGGGTAGTDYGLLATGSTSCIEGATATPGIYTIEGTAGTNVSVTFGNITETEYTYTPEGVYGVYTNATVDNDDTIGILAAGTNTLALAGADDVAGSTGNANVVAGELVLVLGGTLDITAPLTASTPYNSTFTLNVVY